MHILQWNPSWKYTTSPPPPLLILLKVKPFPSYLYVMLQGFCYFSYCGPPIWTYFPLISGSAQLFSLRKQSWKFVSKTSIQFPHVSLPPPLPPFCMPVCVCVTVQSKHSLPALQGARLDRVHKELGQLHQTGARQPAALKPQHIHTILQNRSLSCCIETTTPPHHTSKQVTVLLYWNHNTPTPYFKTGHCPAALKPQQQLASCFTLAGPPPSTLLF